MPDRVTFDAYVQGLVTAATFQDTWVGVPLQFRLAFTDVPPPQAWVGSVRRLVLRGTQVLLVSEPAGPSLLVGGRPEPGESLARALVREVAEETGWLVRVGPLLAVVHAHRTGGVLPADWRRPDPDFFDLIYVSTPISHDPALRVDGQPYAFRDISEVLAVFSDVRRALLEQALAAVGLPSP